MKNFILQIFCLDNPYRKICEIKSLILCLVIILFYTFAASMGWVNKEVAPFLIVCICLLTLLGIAETSFVIFARAKLSGRKMTKEPLEKIKKHFSEDKTFLGYGFRWEPVHKQRLQNLFKNKGHDWKLSPFWHDLMGTYKDILPEHANGKPYLHGVSFCEEAIKCPAQNFDKYLLITGGTQTGKGLTMRLLVNQVIARGDVVIYIDSKGCDHARQSMREAIKAADRGEMLHFNAGSQDVGIRLDLFSNVASADEIAESMIEVLDKDVDQEFKSFVLDSIKAYSIAMIYLGEKPTVKALLDAQSKGIESYLLRMLTKAFQELGNTDEYVEAKKIIGPKATELEILVQWYEEFCRRKDKNSENDFLDVVKYWESPKEHQEKVSAFITNMLSGLTDNGVDKLISPIATDTEDFRTAWSMDRIIDTKGVLYLKLAGMKNSSASGRLGSLILADLVNTLHKRYNLNKKTCRISVFVDEAPEVLNNAFVKLMNQGDKLGLQTTIAVQTIKEFTLKMGSAETAEKVLSNCKNFIALRNTDKATSRYIAQRFTEGGLTTATQSRQSLPDTEYDLPLQALQDEHNPKQKCSQPIAYEYLEHLPDGEYFGIFKDGHLYKGRIPAIITEEEGFW